MKKKILLLSVTAAMSLGLASAIAVISSKGGMLEGRAANVATGSIVFSRSTGTFTKIDDTTASVSGKTALGATYYAVSHNVTDISGSSYIAQFGPGKDFEEQYVSFGITATDTNNFEFQGVTGIKVVSPKSTTFYAYVSNDGTAFTTISVAGSTSPSEVEFDKSYKFVKLGVGSAFERNVTSIQLFYDCSEEPGPAPKEPERIFVANARTKYEQGESFVAPEVYLQYTDESFVELTSGLTFSGYDPEELGDQTITVTYDGAEGHFETTYTVNVYIATLYSIDYEMWDLSTYERVDMSDFMDEGDIDSLPVSFEEGEDVVMDIPLTTEDYFVCWLSINEDQDWDSFESADGVHFTLLNLPYENITVVIQIAPIE